MALRLQAKAAFEDWSVADVGDWLELLGLQKYSQKFSDEAISGRTLLLMDDAAMRQYLGLPIGDVTLLQNELEAQREVSAAKKKHRAPIMLQKGEVGRGETLTDKQRKRIRDWQGDGVRRTQPLTDDELECWDYQASWLACAVTGKSWVSSDSIIGMALYHQPRFCTEQELQRRQLEDTQAARNRSALDAGPEKLEEEKETPKKDERAKGVPAFAAEEEASTADSDDDDGSVWEVVGSRKARVQAESAASVAIAGAVPQAASDITAGPSTRNTGIGLGENYDREFYVYPDVEPPARMHMQPLPTGEKCRRLGFIEVMVGPVFDIKAFNNGSSGSDEAGVLSLKDRGVLCLDRQYNAVNFQFFVQRHPNSFARRLCTSRLSFYIEEGHGKKVFPGNILSQLSLLFYRHNGALNKCSGSVNQEETAECILRAIPKILLQIVIEIVTGVGYDQYTEHAVRLYLLVHHTAIKLLSYFPTAHQRVYDKVKEWIQNPFMDDAIWGPEEAMLAASLVSVPFTIMREPLVRRVLLDMSGGAEANCMKLLKQNQEMLSRITFVHSFFEAGPGRLKVKDLEAKYTRCAGSLPKAEREQLMGAVKQSATESCEDWWRTMGLDGIFSEDDVCARHLMALREHVLKNQGAWRLALRPKAAAQSPAGIGAEELGMYPVPQAMQWQGRLTKAQRLQKQADEVAESRKLHEGYPKLKEGMLSDLECLYCGQFFGSREKLFTHLKKMIPKECMIAGWHQLHLNATPVTATTLSSQPLHCPARCCAGKSFETAEELLDHVKLMGVPGAESLSLPDSKPAEEMQAEHPEPAEENAKATEDAAAAEEQAPVDPFAKIGQCYNCSNQRNALFAQCGHSVACKDCAGTLNMCPLCSATISQKIEVCWS